MLLSLEMSSGEATVCFNIGPAERRKRSVFGSVALGAALIALGAMSIGDVPRLWRIALFVPVWLGALGILQARAGTCVALARRGTRNLDRREEPAPDAELGPVRERARQLYLQSLLVASLVTGLLVWLG